MIELRGTAALVALGMAVALPAAAQERGSERGSGDWPSRPIHFIVPFPAGGSTDVAARVIANSLTRVLGQQIVVENKSGANGNIGIEAAARSPADGYTILVATDAVSSNPHVYKMNIDPLRELVPVIQLSRQPMVLAAHPSLGRPDACSTRARPLTQGDRRCFLLVTFPLRTRFQEVDRNDSARLPGKHPH
jgi:tripartite-type tricarboxylate transporter receptor subunit TctC